MRRDPETQKWVGGALVCFAVKEEAAPFHRQFANHPEVAVLITGMGRRNTEQAIQKRFSWHIPSQVITCGFAGGLNPNLNSGAVIFSGADPRQETDLLAAGATAARFHGSERVLVTAAEKRALHAATGADAVEMESHIITELCRAQYLPCVTVRVVLDSANEDLPLDFNSLMTANHRMNYFKLAGTLLLSPGKIGALMKFQKQCEAAAAQLAKAVAQIIPA